MSKQEAALRLVLLLGVIPGLITVVRSECEDGVCVPLAECDNYRIEEIVNIRLQDSDCEHYLNVCCDPKNIVSQTILPTPRTVTRNHVGSNTPVPDFAEQDETVPKFGQCGIRKKEGVGFRIVDAQHQESQFGEFPWTVAILQYDSDSSSYKYICGGSLIAPNAVLTAAHCVSNMNEDSLLVRAGEWDTMTTHEVLPHQERTVSRFVIHEDFYEKALANDIAIVLLENPFTADEHIQLACLPPQGTIFENNDCFAVGWGKANFHAQSFQAILKKLELPIVPKDHCQPALRATRLGPRFRLHQSFICAGGQQGIDTCTGDGGSPLVCPVAGQDDKYYLAGIVAWGIECGQEGVPGVYVKTSLYTEWINEKLDQNDQVAGKFNFNDIDVRTIE